MFQLPRYVVQAGRMMIDDGELRQEVFGRTLHVAPQFDSADETAIARWFNDHYSIRFRNYPVDESYLGEREAFRVRRSADLQLVVRVPWPRLAGHVTETLTEL